MLSSCDWRAWWRAAVRQGGVALVMLAGSLWGLAVQAQTCSIPGQGGSTASLATQPNTFFAGAAAASAGATSITLGARAGVARDIVAGDLLLVIQMQGADFNAANDNGYGDGTVNAGLTSTVAFGAAGYAGGVSGANFSAGTYEWAVAASAGSSGGNVQLTAPLANSYFVQAGGVGATAFKRAFQVVRVPQYARATLSANLTVQPWDGATGGILAIDVAGDLNLGGFTIDGSGRGFRGGGSLNGVPHNTTCTTTWNPPPAACQHYRQPIAIAAANDTNAFWGGAKGEGISGTPGRRYSVALGHVAGGVGTDGYPNGDMGRGAPGNAGGGANPHNAGGGGGGNGGAGGQGGNSWNSSTAGNRGHLLGGFGGAPVTAGVTRVVLGGGGGAGDLGGNANAVPNGSGGAGGALVFLHASRIVGPGTINVNGEAGRSAAAGETDGAGGGGAGGTVVAKANSLSGALTVNANGGNGGAYQTAAAEQDGAGGGGGGGVLVTNLGGVTFNAAGGAAGTSASTNCAPASPGADCGQRGGSSTAGSSGYAVFAPGVRTGYECMPSLTVAKSTTSPTVTAATGGTAGYVITVSNSGGGVRFARPQDFLPPGWTLLAPATYAFAPATGLAAGAETVAATDASAWSVGAAPLAPPPVGSNALTWSSFALPPVRAGVPSTMTLSFVATIPNTATVGTYHNGAGVDFLDPTRAPATTATVAPATANATHRTATSYGSTVYSQYNGAAATAVAGSHYSGLEAGPTAENVALVPDLRVVKSVVAATATAGQTFNYVIGVQNVGRPVADQVFASTQASSQSATALVGNPLGFTDTLPSGFTATATVSTSPAWTCSGLGSGSVSCSGANPTAAAAYPIAAGTPATPAAVTTVTLTVLPRADNCASTSAINTVTLALAPMGEASSSNNTATVTHAVRCGANLQISKGNGIASVASGQTTAYTVTVSNLGPSAADGTTVTDTVSPGLASCTVTACSASGGAVCPAAAQWPNMLAPASGLAIPTLPAGGAASLVVRCTVSATGS